MRRLLFLMTSADASQCLTAVGLLPIAVSGVDIDAMMQGACDAAREDVLQILRYRKRVPTQVCCNKKSSTAQQG